MALVRLFSSPVHAAVQVMSQFSCHFQLQCILYSSYFNSVPFCRLLVHRTFVKQVRVEVRAAKDEGVRKNGETSNHCPSSHDWLPTLFGWRMNEIRLIRSIGCIQLERCDDQDLIDHYYWSSLKVTVLDGRNDEASFRDNSIALHNLVTGIYRMVEYTISIEKIHIDSGSSYNFHYESGIRLWRLSVRYGEDLQCGRWR